MMLVEKLIDFALAALPAILKKMLSECDEESTCVEADLSGLERALTDHLKLAASWSSYAPNPVLPGQRDLTSVFMELHITQMPRRFRTVSSQPHVTKGTDSILGNDAHTVILGDPGAGKTTIVKHLCQLMLTTDSAKHQDRCSFPLLLRCRNVPQELSLCGWILQELGVVIKYRDKENRKYPHQELQRITAATLDGLGCLLLIDGLDELPSDRCDDFLGDMEYLYHVLSKARIVATCRSGAFTFSLPHCDLLEIMPLDEQQVRDFCSCWLSSPEALSSFYGKSMLVPIAIRLHAP